MYLLRPCKRNRKYIVNACTYIYAASSDQVMKYINEFASCVTCTPCHFPWGAT